MSAKFIEFIGINRDCMTCYTITINLEHIESYNRSRIMTYQMAYPKLHLTEVTLTSGEKHHVYHDIDDFNILIDRKFGVRCSYDETMLEQLGYKGPFDGSYYKGNSEET